MPKLSPAYTSRWSRSIGQWWCRAWPGASMNSNVRCAELQSRAVLGRSAPVRPARQRARRRAGGTAPRRTPRSSRRSAWSGRPCAARRAGAARPWRSAAPASAVPRRRRGRGARASGTGNRPGRAPSPVRRARASSLGAAGAGAGVDERGAAVVDHQVARGQPGPHVERIDQVDAVALGLGETRRGGRWRSIGSLSVETVGQSGRLACVGRARKQEGRVARPYGMSSCLPRRDAPQRPGALRLLADVVGRAEARALARVVLRQLGDVLLASAPRPCRP